MRTLEFKVNGQTLKKSQSCDFSGIVKGSNGYLIAVFQFDEDWDGCAKAVTFVDVNNAIEEATLLQDDKCYIPSSVLNGDKINVSIIGKRADGYKITSTTTTFTQEG